MLLFPLVPNTHPYTALLPHATPLLHLTPHLPPSFRSPRQVESLVQGWLAERAVVVRDKGIHSPAYFSASLVRSYTLPRNDTHKSSSLLRMAISAGVQYTAAMIDYQPLDLQAIEPTRFIPPVVANKKHHTDNSMPGMQKPAVHNQPLGGKEWRSVRGCQRPASQSNLWYMQKTSKRLSDLLLEGKLCNPTHIHHPNQPRHSRRLHLLEISVRSLTPLLSDVCTRARLDSKVKRRQFEGCSFFRTSPRGWVGRGWWACWVRQPAQPGSIST